MDLQDTDPLGSVGTSNPENRTDCFSIFHADPNLWKTIKIKHEQMMKSSTRANKPNTKASLLKTNKK